MHLARHIRERWLEMYTATHCREGGADAPTTWALHYANSTHKLAQFRTQLETKATTKPKIIVIASKFVEQYDLSRRGRVKCEEALSGAANNRLQRPCGRAGGLSETRNAI